MTELGKKPLTLHSQPPSEFKRAYCVSWIFIGRTKAEAETRILWSPDVKSWLIGKDLMLGKIEGNRRGRQRIRWLHGIINSTDMNLSKLQEIAKDREAWCAQSMGVTKSWIRLSDWTELNPETSWQSIHTISFGYHSDIKIEVATVRILKWSTEKKKHIHDSDKGRARNSNFGS